MIRPALCREAALLSLTLLASACANGGATRAGADTSTRVVDTPVAAAVTTATSADSSIPITPGGDGITATVDAGANDAVATNRDVIDAHGMPQSATVDQSTQAEQDYSAIYGEPYDPVADPTLPTPYAAPLSYDPWEKLNRKVYAFNKVVDRAIVRPLAKGYLKVVPDPARQGVSNFFDNLGQPVTIVNALLQGKGRVAMQSLGRFALNTTVGIAGIFDPASKAKIPNRSEDFGQTLGTWGWKRSRFVELPLFGPRTIRDTFGLVGDAPLSPVRYIEKDRSRFFLQGLQLVDVRTKLFPLDNLLIGATDEYALIRDSWLQRRDYQISNGSGKKSEEKGQPLPDYLRDDEDSNPGAPAGVMPIIPGS